MRHLTRAPLAEMGVHGVGSCEAGEKLKVRVYIPYTSRVTKCKKALYKNSSKKNAGIPKNGIPAFFLATYQIFLKICTTNQAL